MSADSIVGQVDNCLYSLHKPQSMSRTSDSDLQEGIWKRMVRRQSALICLLTVLFAYPQSRFRIDGVPIDHLQSQQDVGPISWITYGKADLVADIRFPREPDDDVDLNTILGDIVDNLDDVLRPSETSQHDRIPGRPQLAKGKALEAPTARLRSMLGINAATAGEGEQRCVSIDLDIRFKDVKAVLPVRTLFSTVVVQGVLTLSSIGVHSCSPTICLPSAMHSYGPSSLSSTLIELSYLCDAIWTSTWPSLTAAGRLTI